MTEGAAEDHDAPGGPAEPIGALIRARLSRRAALAGLAAVAAVAPIGAGRAGVPGPASTRFREVPHGEDAGDQVADGYRRRVLIAWGDPLHADAPGLDIADQSAVSQARQFGYNCDFVAFHPLPAGSASSTRGLLVVNHEYTNPELMFPGIGPAPRPGHRVSRAEAETEMAAQGASIVEIRRAAAGWAVVASSALNRRIHVGTPMRIAGPAAGDPRLRTRADPSGTLVRGTMCNCAGGTTPWGTALICEENVHGYFGGDPSALPDPAAYRRYRLTGRTWYAWHRYDPRFDLAREPNEPHRFGWVVEVDPYDPAATPVKRTALGRFAHEGAACIVNGDGRVVVYSGDDARDEHVYRFVTAGRFDPDDRAANRDLLDHGTLSVARFADDGTVAWLPLVQGEGPLTAANGFPDQATVVLHARRAADLVGATAMDRPEDVEADPATGRVYVVLTHNRDRAPEQTDAANPRGPNPHGHVIEIIPPVRNGAPDHAADRARWDIFLAAGRPGVDPGTRYHPGTSADGWLSCPDNCAFDGAGRIWIATDGGGRAGIADGLYAADTAGPGRGLTRQFYRAPVGAEVCGPCFTPDGETLFLAVQHPGQAAGSHLAAPATRWPDFADGPPRPAVIVITRDGGGPIGS